MPAIIPTKALPEHVRVALARTEINIIIDACCAELPDEELAGMHSHRFAGVVTRDRSARHTEQEAVTPWFTRGRELFDWLRDERNVHTMRADAALSELADSPDNSDDGN